MYPYLELDRGDTMGQRTIRTASRKILYIHNTYYILLLYPHLELDRGETWFRGQQGQLQEKCTIYIIHNTYYIFTYVATHHNMIYIMILLMNCPKAEIYRQ